MRAALFSILRRCLPAAALLAVVLPLPAAEPNAQPDAFTPLIEAYERAASPGPDVETYRSLLYRVLQRVRANYALEIDPAPLVDAGLKALAARGSETRPAILYKRTANAALATLDPYSAVLDPEEMKAFRETVAGAFGGLGLEIDLFGGVVRVTGIVEESPAAKAGLRAGDLILRLDDTPTAGMSLADASTRMRGEAGTQITLFVRRPGQNGAYSEAALRLQREIVQPRLLRASYMGDVLVLRLLRFAGNLKSQLDQAIENASAIRRPAGIVLDLRGNPGGTVNDAVVLADTFLAQGEIVSMRGRIAGNSRRWIADGAERLSGVPMVVLLDGASASASELVAGALQDNGRAIVMGQRSFGKGSVQSVVPLGENLGALRLTTALYYTPGGRSVQRSGIAPDIELVLPRAPDARAPRREEDRRQALPGTDAPLASRASVDQANCPLPPGGADRTIGCALAYLREASIEGFARAITSTPAPASAPQSVPKNALNPP